MCRNVVIILTLLLAVVKSEPLFPEDFIFGTATSSFQIEGAWNVSGKGPNIWDVKTHDFSYQIKDGSNGDIACDSYHKFKDDVQLLRELGVDAYRFSLSWSRILPDGYAYKINPDGIRYYNELINELLKYNITPVVTLYHWDLPYELSLIGGWTNEAIINPYLDFARIAFENFGDRVKMWTSFNEPRSFCTDDYVTTFNKMNVTNALAPYLCAHTILKAHGKVYHMYKSEFKTQNGRMSLVLDGQWAIPKTNSMEDRESAVRAVETELDWFAHPVYSKSGDYSPYLKEYLANQSKKENYPKSKLPVFTTSEIQEIRGSFDYFGFNHYRTRLTSKARDPKPRPCLENDIDIDFDNDPNWPVSELDWADVPEGFYNLLVYIKNRYDNPPIYVTENGFAEAALQDTKRQHYYKGYLQALSDAINDGVNVLGYFAWSLLDNFEWFHGYTQKFGLYHVDFTNATRPRTARPSAIWYKGLIRYHKSRNNHYKN